MKKRHGSDPKKNHRSKRPLKAALVTAAAVVGSLAAGSGASAEDKGPALGELKTLRKAPVQKQLTTPRQLKASKPQESKVQLEGTFLDVQRQARATRGTDPMKSKILQAAVDAARARPDFNENASFSLHFALWSHDATEQLR